MATRASTTRPAVAPRLYWGAIMLVCAIAAIAIGWVGYTSSDDASYYNGAVHWLTHPPFAGDSHWTTRYPLVLTLAASLAILGKGPIAMAACAAAWYAIFLVAVRGLATRIGGPRAGWMATLIMATLPVVVANATTVSCDLVEATFLMLGVRFAGDIAAGEPGDWRPIAAGCAFAGAIFCRETTVLALFGFAPIFVAGRPMSRRAIILMALACAALIGLEACYQWALTGDPLNRWQLAFHHDSHIDRTANLEGNFLLWPPIDPLLVLLVNDDFTLLFWLLIPALLAGTLTRLDPAARNRALVLWLLGLTSFALVSLLYTKLVLNPRYFMLAALAAAVIVACWLDRGSSRLRAGMLGVLVAANLLLLSVGNRHPQWPAEALLAAARAHGDEIVTSDDETVHRAEQPLGWAGLGNVRHGVPTPGTLFLEPEAGKHPGDIIVARYPSPPTTAGAVVEALHLDGLVPGAIRRRLLTPNPALLLVRPAAG